MRIVGMSPSAKLAPTDGTSFGLPWSPLAHRYDYWFEMHDRSLWEQRGPEYVDMLRNSDVPIYMQREWEDIPNSVEFPIKQMMRDYFASSISYMIALAISQGYGEIEVYGVDNHKEDEWAEERPCNEWWLGLARGMGIEVWVHPDSSLLKPDLENFFNDDRVTYDKRYGYLAA